MNRSCVVLYALCVLLLCGCAGLQPRPPAPTAEQIVQMSQQKLAPEEIIRRMREADGVYRLSASQLARLREQGVADPVIDYMQGTLMREVRRETAERQLYPYSPWPLGYMPGTQGLGYGSYPWGW